MGTSHWKQWQGSSSSTVDSMDDSRNDVQGQGNRIPLTVKTVLTFRDKPGEKLQMKRRKSSQQQPKSLKKTATVHGWHLWFCIHSERSTKAYSKYCILEKGGFKVKGWLTKKPLTPNTNWEEGLSKVTLLQAYKWSKSIRCCMEFHQWYTHLQSWSQAPKWWRVKTAFKTKNP